MTQPMPERHVGFVLSSGRTGTVFLTRTLGSEIDDVVCVHEPKPSRSLMMLGNARNTVGRGTRILRPLFRRSFARRLAEVPEGSRYVEINPMLCPITDLVADLEGPLRVVHMIRDPRSWVRSIRAFRASGSRRHLIDYVPFATPFPVPRPSRWIRLSHTEQALWRWRYCNEQIASLAPDCHTYELIRYEDLFSADPQMRRTALDRVFAGLEVQLPEDLALDTTTRLNAAPKRAELDIDEDAVQRICGSSLLRELGY